MAGQKTRRKYDAAYKQQVLQMLEDGQPASKLAQSLGIGESLIYRWKSQSKTQSGLENQEAEGSDLIGENEPLRKQVRELEQAQTILKKALSILSQGI